jgi:hypothetical membrane protein
VLLGRRRDAIYARRPLLGPWLYVASVQYFIAQVLVALRFSPGYSLTRNTISDLGNTRCAAWSGRYVCSPVHFVMNASLVVLGLTIIVGSALIYPAFKPARGTAAGFALFAIGGAGVVMVGVFPEDSVSALHGAGAAMPFLVGNIGLLLLGWSLTVPWWLRLYTTLTGGVALFALVLYASNHFLGLGQGGIERVVAYPQTVWQIVVGAYALTRRPRPTVLLG